MNKIGYGFDVHKLSNIGRDFIIGGVKINTNKKIIAHSDGDVLFHSLSNAILSSIGKGDIGEYFPDNLKEFDNLNSLTILSKSIELLQSENYKLINCSINIIIDNPKLSSYRQGIIENISKYCNLTADCVGLTFNTSEGILDNALIVTSIVNIERINNNEC